METLGEKLKSVRIARKMSQSQVAEKLFVSRQSISKWENDVCLPDLDNFQKICDLYNVSPNEMLADTPEALVPTAEKSESHGEPESCRKENHEEPESRGEPEKRGEPKYLAGNTENKDTIC